MKNTTLGNNGFTLIEVLISIAISTVMISIAIGQLISSRTLYSLQEADSRIEENARYALEILSSNIRMAGYKNTHTSDAGTDSVFWQFFNGKCDDTYNPCTNDAAGSDHFAVLLDPESNQTCTGVGVAADAVIANLFFIAPDSGINSLHCRSYTLKNRTATLIANSEETLIEGIESMQILYGLPDLSDLSAESAERYISANSVNAEGTDAWKRIASARVTLLVGTGYNDNAAGSRSYALADAAPITPPDNNRRKIYSTTVAIRNGN